MPTYLIGEMKVFNFDVAYRLILEASNISGKGISSKFKHVLDLERDVVQYFIEAQSELPPDVLESIAKRWLNGLGRDISKIDR